MFAIWLIYAPSSASAQKRAAAAPDTAQTLAVQVALDRAGFSPGEIDGRGGPKTRQATAAFQKSAGLQPSGLPDEETIAALKLSQEAVVNYTITERDVAGPFIDKMPTDMMESAKLQALAYATPLEALAERFHSSQAFLRTLNPAAQWTAGEEIKVPNVEPFELPTRPAATPEAKATAGAKPVPGAKPAAATKTAPAATLEIMISGATKSLTVTDGGKVVMYAPVTIGSSNDPLPVGEWKVTGVSWNPTFNYNPDLFWDADPAHAKAKIAAGPNNPVGVVWVDINKEHFGLHGTPEPSTIGRTESHGCIRLTNWDATRLGRLVGPGAKVTIQ
jgi:lipoprotein-anchoring transpeptidase ErfK/SrfK